MFRGRMHWLGKLVLIACCLPLVAATKLPVASGQQAQQGDGLRGVTVLIVRHAEKPRHGRGLSPVGEQRAQAYADYFAPFRQCGLSLEPQRLIAASNSWASKRSLLTLQPLAAKLGLPIEQRYSKGEVDDLVDSLRQRNQASVILIAWHHGHLDKLLKAFGADPDELPSPWPSDVYNWLLVLHFDAQGHWTSKQSQLIEEHVLPRDDEQPVRAP